MKIQFVSIAAVFAACWVNAQAEEVVIKAFESSGQLVFDRVTNAACYRVEWAPAANEPWSGFVGEAPSRLHYIPGDGSGSVTASVPMLYRVVAFTNPPTYQIIDLSGGSSATNYPVSYLDAEPSGGWAVEYKTTKLVLRLIPAGTFTMGSPTNELGRAVSEDQHQVTLTKDFYVGVFEVTQKQWERVMGTYTSYFTNVTYRDTRPVEQVTYYEIRENPANTDDPAVYWPVSSAVNATSFMGKLRTKTGLTTLDLPTESQWEYACRAGTTTALNSGNNLTNTPTDTSMDAVGRYLYNHPGGFSSDPSVSTDGGTAKVGSYQPNAWGLYDMHGNVGEWCLDWYGRTYYPGSAMDPIDPSGVWESRSSERVLRGGTWSQSALDCRSAERNYYSPYFQSSGIGFRVARTLKL